MIYNNILVLGSGRSGISVSKLLVNLNKTVTIHDIKEIQDINKKNEILDSGIKLITNCPLNDVEVSYDLVVTSPGIDISKSEIFINNAKKNNVKIIGELELSYRLSKGVVIGITGTNGKTTTTKLLTQIIKSKYPKTYAVGNIGTPYSDYVLDSDDDTYFVVEVSSYMLETIDTFKPNISVLLNISNDHIIRHKTHDNYINAKKRIFENQDKNDIAIINMDDEVVSNMINELENKVVVKTFGEKNQDVSCENNKIIANINGVKTEIIDINDIKILGAHNISNVLCAVAVAININIPVDNIRDTIKEFAGVEHRIEYVKTINNVDYYNDSKGTNIDATIKAINAMNKKTVLIAGGEDKQIDLDELILSYKDKVLSAVYVGQCKDKLKQTSDKYSFSSYKIANTYEQAINYATELAEDGMCILLSPACASFDMFKDFEDRGNVYKNIVNNL